MRNRTGVEDWILEKAVHRRGALDEPFIYPYDLGRWMNLCQVKYKLIFLLSYVFIMFKDKIFVKHLI